MLVLGGTRYAGIHLVNELIASNCYVTIATGGTATDSFGDKVRRKIIERYNPDSLHIAFCNEQYDVVIDNLAYCSNDVRVLMESIRPKKYVMTSTISIYRDFHMGICENEFDPWNSELNWCERDDFTYDEVKRQAETALFQAYKETPSVAVRFPWIFGSDDYTKRLYFYVEHVFTGQAMNVDNLGSPLAFISSRDAGAFLAWCALNPVAGCVNACSNGTITLNEIIKYTEKHLNKRAVINDLGEPAPLNSVPGFSLSSMKAQELGYCFQDVTDWVYPTIDHWIDSLRSM